MARYSMTARRRAALRKAQLASARKRRGGRKSLSRRKKAAITGGGVLATMGGLAGARHYISGSSFNVGYKRNDADQILHKMMGGKKQKPYAFYTFKNKSKRDRVFGGLIEYKGHSIGGRYHHVSLRGNRPMERAARAKARAGRQEVRAFNSRRQFKREVRRTIRQL